MKGKSKLLLQKRGRVTEVVTEGSKKKFRVEWTDSTSGVIFARSLEKISADVNPPPFIGPIIGEQETPPPHREDEYYREDNEESDDGMDSDGQSNLDVENEQQPEDGLVETPAGPQRRCVLYCLYFVNLHHNHSFCFCYA